MEISQRTIIDGAPTNPLADARSYLKAWATIGSVVLVDVVGLHDYGFRILFGGSLRPVLALAFIAFVIFWAGYRAKTVRVGNKVWIARLGDLAFTGQWMIALAAFCTAASILSNLSVAVASPLIDDHLVKLDRIVGFDWLVSYHWIQEHPGLRFVLNVAYCSGLVQMVAVPFIVGITGRRVELVHHVARLMIATLICLAIATKFPAASAFLHFHIVDPGTSDTVSSFSLLRSGALRVIDLTVPQGLVSMPSMHTAMAVLFVYALRRVPFLAYGGALLNVVMILSTPTQGGHYLCDVAGGALLAFAAIFLVNDRRRSRDVHSFGSDCCGGVDRGF